MMNVLVIGSGGREHALVWKAGQSRLAGKIHCLPGNAGIDPLASCVGGAADDLPFIEKYCSDNGISTIIVGPEVPLISGMADYFLLKGYKVFGPRKAAARLEGSKIFAKNFMKKHGIPTAAFEVFDNPEKAEEFARAPRFENASAPSGYPIVIKADGLAAGKGVIICGDGREAEEAIDSLMRRKTLGKAGSRIIIEECLKGEEVSVLCLTDGRTIVPMLPVQDHKRIFDGDKGPNTGGMGCYSPVPLVTPALAEKIREKVLEPTLAGLKKEKLDYLGVIYAGIMVVKDEPFVLEYNVRFGDPETQVLMPLLKTDFLEIVESVCSGKLGGMKIGWKKEACVCVIMAGADYPVKSDSGKIISGLDRAGKLEGVLIFHSGTAFGAGGKTVTAGGRILGVTAMGENLEKAIEKAYSAVRLISFEGARWRKDIGKKGLICLNKK